MTSAAHETAQDPGLHIYMRPETIVENLATLALDQRTAAKRRLAESAITLHAAALAQSVETGDPIDIPAAATWPKIVGSEMITLMALRRHETGREVIAHPTDTTKHLLVPRKPDIL